jgi:hypothetical protein
MNKLLAALGLSTALMASAALPLADGAQAAMAYGGLGADVQQRQIAPIEEAQFFFGGYNYCWYDDGWQGPGWYWCGYAWNQGLGWGGGWGWHHWRHWRHEDHYPHGLGGFHHFGGPGGFHHFGGPGGFHHFGGPGGHGGFGGHFRH